MFLLFIPSFLRVSRLIALAVVGLVRIPPLSRLSFLEKRKTMERTSISFCLPLADLYTNVLSQITVFVLWCISFVHWTCFCLMLLEYYSSCLEKNLLSVRPTCLLCLHSLDSLSFLFVLFLYCVCASACLVFYGFCFVSLECSSSSWDCLFFIALSWCCFFYFMSGLLVCLWGFSGLPFYGNPLGGGRTRRDHIFFGFSHNPGAFGWKQALSPRARVLCKCLLLQKRASSRSKNTSVFNAITGNARRMGFQSGTFAHDKWSTLIYEIHCLGNIRVLVSGGGVADDLKEATNPTKIGVLRFTDKGFMRVCVREWGAYVAQHKHPVFERIRCASQSGHFRTEFVSDTKVSPGENTIFSFRMVPSWGKKGSILQPIKSTPILNTTTYIYILTYTYIYVCWKAETEIGSASADFLRT